MSEPLILVPNLASASSLYYGTYGIGSATQLFDRNKETIFTSTGATTDGTFVTLMLMLGAEVQIDRVIVLNHNLKLGSTDGISIYGFLDGVSVLGDKTYQDTVDGSGRAHTVITFAEKTIDQLNFIFSKTQTPNQEKSLGEIILSLLWENIGVDFSSYDQRWREKGRELILGDGGLHRIVTPASNGRVSRYEANCQFRYMPEAMMDTLRNLKDSGEEFLFMPESTTRPQDVYLCHFAGPWSVQYSSSYKGAGYTVNMQVKEV